MSTATKQREVDAYDDITLDTTSRLLVRIVSFASALIEYKYGRTVARRTTTIPLAWISGPRVTRRLESEVLDSGAMR